MSKLQIPILKHFDDCYFAFFNQHDIDFQNAKQNFIKEFSKEDFKKEIQPFVDEGIMSIFQTKPNDKTRWFVYEVSKEADQRVVRDGVSGKVKF
jgi:polysaccharide pyruvyl transferase WcaK-like protein